MYSVSCVQNLDELDAMMSQIFGNVSLSGSFLWALSALLQIQLSKWSRKIHTCNPSTGRKIRGSRLALATITETVFLVKACEPDVRPNSTLPKDILNSAEG